MKPLTPPAYEGTRGVMYAKNQPQYDPLPARLFPDGCVLTEWQPTAEELARILDGKPIRLWCWTFNRPLQPVALEVGE
jgi:hypothetical protein